MKDNNEIDRSIRMPVDKIFCDDTDGSYEHPYVAYISREFYKELKAAHQLDKNGMNQNALTGAWVRFYIKN